MTDRQWWPGILLDEHMPPGKPRPEDWLAPDVNGRTVIYFDDERSGWSGHLLPGRPADFIWHEPRGSIEILVMPDGTWSEHRPERCPMTPDLFDSDRKVVQHPPDGEANFFAWSEDAECSAGNLDEFALAWSDMDALPDEGVIVVVDRHYWSDTVTFVVSADGKSLLPYKPTELP